MKKLIALLLALTLSLPMTFAASAESSEIQGKGLDQMLSMYCWMMGRIWDKVPSSDTFILRQREDNKISFTRGFLGGRTFPNSEIIERAGVMLPDSDLFKDELNACTWSLIFAMKYTFKDTVFMDDPWKTISEELAPIVSAVLAGETYVSDPYVYYLESINSLSIAVSADHIDLYRAEHPEFTE